MKLRSKNTPKASTTSGSRASRHSTGEESKGDSVVEIPGDACLVGLSILGASRMHSTHKYHGCEPTLATQQD